MALRSSSPTLSENLLYRKQLYRDLGKRVSEAMDADGKALRLRPLSLLIVNYNLRSLVEDILISCNPDCLPLTL